MPSLPSFSDLFVAELDDGRLIIGLTPASLRQIEAHPMELRTFKVVLLYAETMDALLQKLTEGGLKNVPTP